MNMEFLSQNILNTTTMVAVSSGTSTVANLFDRKNTKQYQTVGQSDTVGMTLTVNFNITTAVDRIVLENHNLKSFKVYYNGTTTNLFSLGTGNITSTTDLSNNSATNLYFHFDTPVNATSVSIVATTTMVANEQKKIGQFWATNKQYRLPINPDRKGYKPKIETREFEHQMSDGGSAVYRIQSNYIADISLQFQSATVRTNLKTIYDAWSEFVFAPRPTGTSWDGRIYEVNWLKGFDFEQYSDNYIDNGFNGKIRLKETPR